MSLDLIPAADVADIMNRVMNGAADLIEARGFAKGADAQRGGGPICAAYAIVDSSEITLGADDDLVYHAAGLGYKIMEDLGYAQRNPGELKHPLVGWNDAPERTKEDVVCALRIAGEYAAKKVMA